MKKQITLDGEKSDWFEKAIFVLKDKPQQAIPNNLFYYAEDIIETYLKKNPSVGYKREYKQAQKAYKETTSLVKQGKPYDKGESVKKKRTSRRSQWIDAFLNVCLILCSIGIVSVLTLMFA